MKNFIKILLLITTLILGGLLGAWAAPTDMISDTSSFSSIILIAVGALGGLIFGGLAILLCD